METKLTELSEGAAEQKEKQEALENELKTEKDARKKQEDAFKKGKRELLIRSIGVLKDRLKEKRIELCTANGKVSDLDSQIKDEEKYLENFTVERDESTKIIVTLGMTGSGKSTLCNRLKGDKSRGGNKGGIRTSGGSKSCTQDNSKHHVQIGDHRMTVIDTPGLGDSNGRARDRRHCNRLCAFMKGCGGINAFVLVRNGAIVRFDKHFQNMLTDYVRMFGDEFLGRLIVVATRIEGRTLKRYKEKNRGEALW